MERTSLVQRCDGWDALLAELAQRAGCQGLASVPRKLAAAVLAAPAAIALWIAVRASHLAGRARLKLLVIGAETVDAVDEGRWYALIPELLDGKSAVEVTLLGEQLDAGFSSDAARFAPAQPARRVAATLGAFLEREDIAGYDLAVMFHPGMQKNRGWLEDGSLAQIVAAGTTLLASAYEAVECEMDQWVIESHGYAASGEPLLNPYYLDLSDGRTTIQWARTLWQFGPSVPAAGSLPDHERLAGLDLLTRMVMHSMMSNAAPTFDPGVRIELQSSAGATLSLIHVFDGYCLDLDKHRVLRLTAAGQLVETGTFAREDVAAYPTHGARDIERAIWAARIKARGLLGRGAPEGLDELAARRAAGMYAALRERARGLFRM